VGYNEFKRKFRSIGKQLHVTILGDNDFYSQRKELVRRSMDSTLENISNLPSFCSLQCTLAQVAKTGLGSSAALVSSIVGSILLFFQGTLNLDLVHNVAQLAHCLAQGKIGSGFDIASAIYGSHIYQRFLPERLVSLLELGVRPSFLGLEMIQLCN
jgi:phosphomevalonate kinase